MHSYEFALNAAHHQPAGACAIVCAQALAYSLKNAQWKTVARSNVEGKLAEKADHLGYTRKHRSKVPS